MFLKKILPVENYTIVTPLSKEEVYRRLAQNIEPRKGYRFWGTSSTRRFEGEISPGAFNIQRVISYRNSFLPQIKGQIASVQQKTHIQVTMQLDILIMVFMGCWLLGTGLLSAGVIVSQLHHFDADKFTFIPVVMFVFGCLMVTIGFRPECNSAKKFLAGLLEAEPGK